MSVYPVVAALLAAALLTVPPPGRRLAVAKRPRRRPPAALAVIGLPFVVAAAVAAPAATLSGVLAASMAQVRRRHRRRRRLRRTEGDRMAAALQTVVGELRVGAHPVRAFGTAAAESGGDLGVALRAVAARARLGSDVAAGLRQIGSASVVPVYWSRVEVCWRLAAEHGLPMSLLMRAAQRDILERQRYTDRVQAALAGARATAAILAGLPVLGVVLGELVGAQPVRFLLGGGGWLLVAGTGLVCAGVGWADRIIDRLAT